MLGRYGLDIRGDGAPTGGSVMFHDIVAPNGDHALEIFSGSAGKTITVRGQFPRPCQGRYRRTLHLFGDDHMHGSRRRPPLHQAEDHTTRWPTGIRAADFVMPTIH